MNTSIRATFFKSRNLKMKCDGQNYSTNEMDETFRDVPVVWVEEGVVN